MLNTWWLCVILQYHSISHAFCRHTINGIPFHYLDVWYAVILISHYFSLGIRLLYKLWYCDNDFIKTMWKSVSLLHLPENHWCSKTCRWNRGFTSVSLIPLMSPPYSSVCKRCLIEEWLDPNHSAKAYQKPSLLPHSLPLPKERKRESLGDCGETKVKARFHLYTKRSQRITSCETGETKIS